MGLNVEAIQFDHGEAKPSTRPGSPLYKVSGFVGYEGLRKIVDQTYSGDAKRVDAHQTALDECEEVIDTIFTDGAVINNHLDLKRLAEVTRDIPPVESFHGDSVYQGSLTQLTERHGILIPEWVREVVPSARVFVTVSDLASKMEGDLNISNVPDFQIHERARESIILGRMMAVVRSVINNTYETQVPLTERKPFPSKIIIGQKLLEMVPHYGFRMKSRGLTPLQNGIQQ